MKEKKVDVYLASAGFFQVMFYGFGGTFLTGFTGYGNMELRNLLGSGLATLVCGIMISYYYVN